MSKPSFFTPKMLTMGPGIRNEHAVKMKPTIMQAIMDHFSVARTRFHSFAPKLKPMMGCAAIMMPSMGVNANDVAFIAIPSAASAVSTDTPSTRAYSATTMLKTKLTHMEPTCVINDAMPMTRMRPSRRISGTRFLRRKRNAAVFTKMKYAMVGIMPHAWPKTVAQALPATPQPHTITKR